MVLIAVLVMPRLSNADVFPVPNVSIDVQFVKSSVLIPVPVGNDYLVNDVQPLKTTDSSASQALKSIEPTETK